MRNYDFTKKWEKLLTPDIVALLTQIHEYKGKQGEFLETKADTLEKMTEVAKIQSAEASNKIEGIYTSDDRLNKILKNKTMPQNRSEREIAGYRDVLNTIHESYDSIPMKPSIILQLHRDIYKYEGYNIGGSYKNGDNIIEEEDSARNKFIRFEPVSAWETPEAVDELCKQYYVAFHSGKMDSLLLIPMFILDFLCIHPFLDGNGRMSRLLTLLLLYQSGYMVGKYISIEKLIETTKESYYEVLEESSKGWHEGKNDYEPFVKYMLGVIMAAYREFSSRIEIITVSGISKPDRIADIIEGTLGKITKTELLKKCPDISQTTIQRTLNDLVKNKKIIKIGGGRYTSYTWNREDE